MWKWKNKHIDLTKYLGGVINSRNLSKIVLKSTCYWSVSVEMKVSVVQIKEKAIAREHV